MSGLQVCIADGQLMVTRGETNRSDATLDTDQTTLLSRRTPTADSTTRSPSAELPPRQGPCGHREVPAPLPLPQPTAVSDRTHVVEILESHPGLSG